MIQHTTLAQGRWNELCFAEQMANIGSEVERSIKWREKQKPEFFEKAFDRALELLDLTIADPKNRPRLKEITRTREGLVDFLWGTNSYHTRPELWRTYFTQWIILARKKMTP